MLNEKQFKAYCKQHNLDIETIEYIQTIRSSQPTRQVGTHAFTNVTSAVYSPKMEHTINVESRTAERAFFYLCEYSEEVIEIWEQIEPIRLNIINKAGRKQGVTYTPDFLILTNGGPKIIEVKTLSTLEELVKKNTNNWVKRRGIFTYLPAKEYYKKLDLPFEVFYPKEETPYRVANIELLLASRTFPCFTNAVENKLAKLFKDKAYLTLKSARKALELPDYTYLIQAIDSGLIYFDISNSLLSEAESTYITSHEGNLALFPHVFNVKKEEVLNALEMTAPSEKQLKKGLLRLERLQAGERTTSTRRWNKLIDEGKKEGLSELEVLCSIGEKVGNRKAKIPNAVSSYLNKYLISQFLVNPGRKYRRAYFSYCVKAKDVHPKLLPASLMTFHCRAKMLESKSTAMARGGKRQAAKLMAPTTPSERALKSIPWASASIDHCLVKLNLVFHTADNTTYTERPWLTILVDNCTGDVLATYFTFLPPSRNSCAAVLRECVRRHGCLPKEIISDRGSDFQSVYYRSVLAHYTITYTQRPAGQSRYGAEVERFFGEFSSEWLSARPGNSTDYKNARSIDGNKAPKKWATLSPEDFYQELLDYCNWRSGKGLKGKLNTKGGELDLKRSLYPFTPVQIEFDMKFMLYTAVDSKKYKIDFQRGLHIGRYHYYHPKLLELKGKKKTVDVRLDPECPHIVYAYVQSSWVCCTTSYLKGHSMQSQARRVEEGVLTLGADKLLKRLDIEHNIKLAEKLEIFHNRKKKKPEKHTAVIEKSYDNELFQQLANVNLEALEVKEWEDE